MLIINILLFQWQKTVKKNLLFKLYIIFKKHTF